MKRAACLPVLVFILLLLSTGIACAGNDIPSAAWRRPIGLPLEHPGVNRDAKGLLVQDAGSMGDQRKFPSLYVYAARRHLGNGNDATYYAADAKAIACCIKL